MKRPALAAAAALAVFLLAASGYWMHGAWDKRTQQHKVIGLLRDTTEELRRGLAPRAPASVVASIDGNLQAAKAPRDPRLAEAAELYIIGAREIVRRRVEAERLERQAAASRAALTSHMTRGARRTEAWFHGALELKKRVERDHYELNLTLKALDELLYTLPEAEERLAPHVAPAVLLDEAERREARRQLALETQRADAALGKVRGLAVR
jgi:hypothetical protein